MLVQLDEVYKKANNLSLPHRGIVVDNEDPLGLKRVRVVIESLIEDCVQEALPWMAAWNPSGQGGNSGSVDGDVPAIGSELVIEFPFGDIYSGFYTGYWVNQQIAPKAFSADYPQSSGQQDEAGNKTTVNRATGETVHRHPSGTEVSIDKSGNVRVTSKGTIVFEDADERTYASVDGVTGIVSLAGKESVDLMGPKTQLLSDEVTVATQEWNEEVAGAKTVAVVGAATTKVGGSRSDSTLGNYSQVVGGTTNQMFAQAVSQAMGMGMKLDIATVGMLVNVLLGQISLTCAPTSNVTLNPAMASLTGAIAQLVGLAQVQIQAPLISLGLGLAPITTILSDPIEDYITGKPKIGVPTILAG